MSTTTLQLYKHHYVVKAILPFIFQTGGSRHWDQPDSSDSMALLDFVYRRKNDLVEQQKIHLVEFIIFGQLLLRLLIIGSVKVSFVSSNSWPETLLRSLHDPNRWYHRPGRLWNQNYDYRSNVYMFKTQYFY